MKFTEKYTSDAEKDLPESKNKIILTNDTYALGEVLQTLINAINDFKGLRK